MQDPLPNKLSELLIVDLDVLEKAEQDPRYVVRMETWHTPYPDTVSTSFALGKQRAAAPLAGRCGVCMAGAVMAFGLGIDINHKVTPNSFDEYGLPSRYTTGEMTIVNKLMAINDLRVGNIEDAFIRLGLEHPKHFPKVVDIMDYRNKSTIMKAQLRELAADLAAAGA